MQQFVPQISETTQHRVFSASGVWAYTTADDILTCKIPTNGFTKKDHMSEYL